MMMLAKGNYLIVLFDSATSYSDVGAGLQNQGKEKSN